MSESRSAQDVKTELLQSIPEKFHGLVEELDSKRRYAWQQFFKLEQRYKALLRRGSP